MPVIPPAVPAHWRLPAHPASVRRARSAVTEALAPGLRARLADDLGLLASELVTNAIRYGARAGEGDLVEVVLWPAGGHYWLAVSDPGTGDGGDGPRVVRPGVDAEAGRWLLLVDRLASAWVVRPRPVRGTSVVAGLALDRDG